MLIDPSSRSEERGFALIVAMLSLLVLAMFSAILLMSAAVQTRIAGQDARRARALDLAEAGVAEAITRLKSGDVPLALNPRMVTQVFNTAAGSVPVLGTDSTALATSQAAGQWLNYSASGCDPGALTIRFKTDASRTVIYRYDSSRNPAVNTVSGQPIFEITSTGTVGSTQRTIVVEVVSRPPSLNAKGAITSGGQIQVGNSDYICGYNHSLSTPDWTSRYCGRSGPNPGVDPAHSTCSAYETGTGNVAAIWGAGQVQPTSTPPLWGSPAALSGQSGMYSGPWDALGMTQAAFQAWLPPRRTTAPASWNGSFYLDKNATLGDSNSPGWTLSNVTGEGFLYIEGQVQVTGTFFWKGLVYVNGQFQHQGTIWILGGFVGQYQNQTENQSGAILYSKDAIDFYLSQYAGVYTRLSWREASS